MLPGLLFGYDIGGQTMFPHGCQIHRKIRPCYGYTSFKSESDATFDFWIGFKDISRSHNDVAPPLSSWDYQHSNLWLNHQPVSPPMWANAGKGSHEMPLVDEGVVYRTPMKLVVKKGWNQILVKCPVENFKGENSNEAVKWMFTVVPVHQEKRN